MSGGNSYHPMISIFIISVLLPQIFAIFFKPGEAEKCDKHCGGKKAVYEAYEKGEVLCNLARKDIYEVHPPCMYECMGITVSEDQVDCMTKLCKMKRDPYGNGRKGHNNIKFCKGANEPPITLEECDTLVPSGEAKYSWSCARPPTTTPRPK